MPPYSADDFDIIRARVEELRKERGIIVAGPAGNPTQPPPYCEHEWKQLEGSEQFVCTKCLQQHTPDYDSFGFRIPDVVLDVVWECKHCGSFTEMDGRFCKHCSVGRRP